MAENDIDEVFISGLPLDVTEEEIATYFGQIGIIKEDRRLRKPKIWMYRDKATGELKGEATVTYDDPFAASAAPAWFDNKEFKGNILHVSLSDRKAAAAAAYAANPDNQQHHRGGGGDRGGYGGRDGGHHRGVYESRDRDGGGGGGGGQSRPGDWKCPGCGNNCFARKSSCNRCGASKEGGGGRGGGGGGGRGGGGREGDWMCTCGNSNFGWRNECNRCGSQKTGGGGGGGDRSDRGGGGGRDSSNRYSRDDREGDGHRGSSHHRGGGGGGGRDRERSPPRRDRY